MIIVKKPGILQNKYHYENEEKPIVDAQEKSSEDFHGGDEITQSVNDQRFAVDEQNNQNSEDQQQDQQSEEQNEEENQQQNNDNIEDQQPSSDQQAQDDNNENEQNNEENDQQQSEDEQTQQQTEQQQNSEEEQNEEQIENQNNVSDKDQQIEDQQNNQEQQEEEQNEEDEQDQQNEQQNNDNKENDQQPSSDQQAQQQTEQHQNSEQNNEENEQPEEDNVSSDQQNEQQIKEEKNNSNSEEQNSEQHDNNENEQNNEENDQQSSEEEDNEENEQSSEDDEEDTSDDDDYESEEDEEQENTTEYNTEEVVEISKKSRIIKKLYLEFYRLVEYLADEEKVPSTVPGQSIILNIRKLMFRQYEHKPISSYYYYKARSQVVLILDNSGSMNWLVEELNTFFNVALKRKDIEIYIAPNGNIEKYYDFRKKDFVEINHLDAMNQIRQSALPVIYIGDYDGTNTPVELSWTNRTYWICPETRYKYFRSHDWVKYDEEDFKGFFGRAFNDGEIIEVLQHFSKNIMKQKFWYDKHDEKEFEDYYN